MWLLHRINRFNQILAPHVVVTPHQLIQSNPCTRCGCYTASTDSIKFKHQMWLLHRINRFNQILARISPNPIYLFTWGYRQLLCNFHLPICEKAPSTSLSSFSSAQNNTGCSKIHFTEIVHLTMSNLTRVRFLISTVVSTSDIRLSARTHTRTRTHTYIHAHKLLFLSCVVTFRCLPSFHLGYH